MAEFTPPSPEYWRNPPKITTVHPIEEPRADKPIVEGPEVVPQAIDDKLWRLFLQQMMDRQKNHAHLLRELYDFRERVIAWMASTDNILSGFDEQLAIHTHPDFDRPRIDLEDPHPDGLPVDDSEENPRYESVEGRFDPIDRS